VSRDMYTAIIQLTVFEEIEADTYKEAVQKAQMKTDELNLLGNPYEDLTWTVESVQEDDKQ
jgi:hypothetical protein